MDHYIQYKFFCFYPDAAFYFIFFSENVLIAEKLFTSYHFTVGLTDEK